MKVCKIESTFCKDDQVQITFNNAPAQLICSKDGYIYYRFDDLILHRYMTNPRRYDMKYCHIPFSHKHANHFFKFDQPYIFFTPYDTPDLPYNFIEDTYHMRFLYFTKLPNGDAVYAETTWKKKQNSETKIMTLEEVKKFLYDISDVDGKYILTWSSGIKYAKSKNEIFTVDKYIDLSYENILKNCNTTKKMLGFKELTSIDEIDKTRITSNELGYQPMIITISGNDISIASFSITCHGKDKFEVELTHFTIDWDIDSLPQIAENLPYTDTLDNFF